MACCAALEWEPEDTVDGECDECGAETIGGVAKDQCSYSQCECEKCGWRPCDLSC